VVTPCQTNDSCRTPRNGVINECVAKKSSLLCFVVAGGGFPGEPSGHSITSCVVCCRPIHTWREHAPRCTCACRNCDPSRIRRKAPRLCTKQLAERGVDIHVNTNLRSVSMYGVRYVGRDDVNRVFQVTCVVRLTLRKLLAGGTNVGGTGD